MPERQPLLPLAMPRLPGFALCSSSVYHVYMTNHRKILELSVNE